VTLQAVASRRTGIAAPRRGVVVWSARIGLMAAFLGVWQIQGSRSQYALFAFSTPSRVAQQFGTWLGDAAWWADLGTTVQEAALGYLLGVAVAVVLVAVTAPSRLLTRYLSPFIAAFNALPKIALAPLFILLFGTSLRSKVLFVASLICFLVFYGVLAALRTIDRTLIANMRVLGASSAELVLHVYAPATLGQVIAGLRLSSAWALLAAVIAEYLGANEGLGHLIADAQQTFQTDAVLAGIIAVAVIAVALDRALVVVERRLSRWRLEG
jgi:ABC-type nitrate/sulfonate/bicarbonate transport system permease component